VAVAVGEAQVSCGAAFVLAPVAGANAVAVVRTQLVHAALTATSSAAIISAVLILAVRKTHVGTRAVEAHQVAGAVAATAAATVVAAFFAHAGACALGASQGEIAQRVAGRVDLRFIATMISHGQTAASIGPSAHFAMLAAIALALAVEAPEELVPEAATVQIHACLAVVEMALLLMAEGVLGAFAVQGAGAAVFFQCGFALAVPTAYNGVASPTLRSAKDRAILVPICGAARRLQEAHALLAGAAPAGRLTARFAPLSAGAEVTGKAGFAGPTAATGAIVAFALAVALLITELVLPALFALSPAAVAAALTVFARGQADVGAGTVETDLFTGAVAATASAAVASTFFPQTIGDALRAFKGMLSRRIPFRVDLGLVPA